MSGMSATVETDVKYKYLKLRLVIVLFEFIFVFNIQSSLREMERDPDVERDSRRIPFLQQIYRKETPARNLLD